MPRLPRLHVAGAFYHVTLRGNHRQPIFQLPADRQTLNGVVSEVLERFDARAHARLSTTGHLFERRYHAVLVDVDSYLLELIRYIDLNPVRAQLVADPADYPWSSHGTYLGRRVEPWVTTDFALRMFHPDVQRARTAYRAFILRVADDGRSVDSFAGHSDDARVLGDDQFLTRVVPAPPRPRSRLTLDQLIEHCCRHCGVSVIELATPSRRRDLSRARALIGYQAGLQRIASLAAVARRLGRDESSLRQCIERHRRKTPTQLSLRATSEPQ